MIKVKNDHRSIFSNLSNWKEETWKKSGLQQDSNPWLRDTGAMLYQLSYEATHPNDNHFFFWFCGGDYTGSCFPLL